VLFFSFQDSPLRHSARGSNFSIMLNSFALLAEVVGAGPAKRVIDSAWAAIGKETVANAMQAQFRLKASITIPKKSEAVAEEDVKVSSCSSDSSLLFRYGADPNSYWPVPLLTSGGSIDCCPSLILYCCTMLDYD
jgi:hypothetical protein